MLKFSVAVSFLAIFVIASCEARNVQIKTVKSIDDYINAYPEFKYQSLESFNSLTALQRNYTFGKRVPGILI